MYNVAMIILAVKFVMNASVGMSLAIYSVKIVCI